MKNKKNNLINDFLLPFFSYIFIIWILFSSYIYISVWKSAKDLPQITQQEYLRIKIYGSSSSIDGNTVSATFSIIDSNGNEIAVIERSWTGSYLGVEFTQTKINNKYFVFPSKIYGKERIMENKTDRKKGTSLEKYYNDNKQCMLLGYGSSLLDRQKLYKIARFSTKKVPVINFGYTSTYDIDLSDCKNEKYYSITVDSQGKIKLIEL